LHWTQKNQVGSPNGQILPAAISEVNQYRCACGSQEAFFWNPQKAGMKTSTDERREAAKEPTKNSPAVQVPKTVGTSDICTAMGSTTTVHDAFLSSSLPASAVTLCGAAAAVARLTIVENSRVESQLVPKFTSEMQVSMQECLIREQPAQRLYL